MNHTKRSKTEPNSVYFPNLNGLRFFAAAAVIIHHTEQIKWRFGLPNVWTTSAPIALIGKLGVVLFFVLSGFLITYLLLEEERRTGQISVSRFYVRRALRIWPLYYLIIILALFVLPYSSLFARPDIGIHILHQNLLLKFALYATFFANVVLANVGLVPYASHAWSIGTEEQFYLVWPILMKRIPSKVSLMLAVILFYLVGRFLMESGLAGTGSWQTGVLNFISLFNVDCMAIGGLAAVMLYQQSKLLGRLINQPVFYLTLITAVVFVARGVAVPYLHYELYSVLFAILILNFTTDHRLSRSLEFEPLHYLGKISYGLYLLHPLAIVASIKLLKGTGWSHDALLYPTCFAITIGLAALSYRFLETPFLRLKPRFAIVQSGETARVTEHVKSA